MPKGQYNRTKPHAEEELSTEMTQTVDPMAAFLEALKQMSADNRETTLAAIAEMKKPSEAEQDAIDREKASQIEQTTRRVEAAKGQAEELAVRRSQCAHVMPNGQTNFRGQVLSNGWAGVFCSYCWDAYTFEATETERNASGLNVDKWGPNAFTIIKSRAEKCKGLTPPPVPKVPAGATIIFG